MDYAQRPPLRDLLGRYDLLLAGSFVLFCNDCSFTRGTFGTDTVASSYHWLHD